MYGLLLASHDAEQLRAAVRANALEGGTTVFHGHFLRLGHFFLRFALHTIRFCHGACLPFGSSFTRKTCGASYWHRLTTVKVQNRDEKVGEDSRPGQTYFAEISGPIVITPSGDTTTNYTDSGGATNGRGRYYRIRRVP
jgi:hypothetical protein